MPPGYDLDRLTYEVHLDPTITAADVRNEPLRFYTTTEATNPLDEPITRTTLRDYITIDPQPITTTFVTKRDLEYYAERLYKIIEEHTAIDIAEEEFMRLIKDDD